MTAQSLLPTTVEKSPWMTEKAVPINVIVSSKVMVSDNGRSMVNVPARDTAPGNWMPAKPLPFTVHVS